HAHWIWTSDLCLVSRVAARYQQSKHLSGLAHPHIVRQAAAEREAAEKLDPAQALPLVIAQATHKTRRLRGASNALKQAQFVAHAGESLVAASLGLCGQQGIEQARLAAAETNV